MRGGPLTLCRHPPNNEPSKSHKHTNTKQELQAPASVRVIRPLKDDRKLIYLYPLGPFLAEAKDPPFPL